MSTSWENSKKKYTQLLNGLDNLISDTVDVVDDYEDKHMHFGNLIYEKKLTGIMKDSDLLDEYEREFKLMYYSLKGQVERLKRYRKVVSMMTIKDPHNYPEN